MNMVKRICKEYDLTYKDLAECIGYNPYSLSNLINKNDEELPKPLKATLTLLKENYELKAKLQSLDNLKRTFKEFLEF